MVRVIPNLTASIQLGKSVVDVSDALRFIPYLSHRYKLNEENAARNQFTFECSDLLNAGVYINVSYSFISESLTDINIEVRSKCGSFNKRHEVMLAHQHIDNMLDLLSDSCTLNDAQIRAKLRIIENEKNRKVKLHEQAVFAKTESKEEKPYSQAIAFTGQVLLWVFILVAFGGILLSFYRLFYR